MFGSAFYEARNIKTVEQMDEAIDTVFWFRESLGLEFAIAFDQPYFPGSNYASCTNNTQNLATILTIYIVDNCCEDRFMNYEFILQRIIFWMDCKNSKTSEDITNCHEV